MHFALDFLCRALLVPGCFDLCFGPGQRNQELVWQGWPGGKNAALVIQLSEALQRRKERAKPVLSLQNTREEQLSISCLHLQAASEEKLMDAREQAGMATVMETYSGFLSRSLQLHA